jgi:hypothetical protein
MTSQVNRFGYAYRRTARVPGAMSRPGTRWIEAARRQRGVTVMRDGLTAEVADERVVRVERIGPVGWRAWSGALPKPRYASTAARARRRIHADLDHEWRTGRPHPRQRAGRTVDT